MAESAVVNTSPLIFLTEVGRLELLQAEASRVVLPATVAAEILRWGEDDRTVRAVADSPWLTTVADVPAPLDLHAWDLGAGETAVLAFALATGARAILDDLAARRCAKALGVPVRGTLGVLLAAKRSGRIPSVRPILDRLRSSGMYLSDEVLRRALALVGE